MLCMISLPVLDQVVYFYIALNVKDMRVHYCSVLFIFLILFIGIFALILTILRFYVSTRVRNWFSSHVAYSFCALGFVPCTNDTLRLVNGYKKYTGRLEICINGVWSTVCNDSWTNTNTQVACRQLGYPSTSKFIVKACYCSELTLSKNCMVY